MNKTNINFKDIFNFFELPLSENFNATPLIEGHINCTYKIESNGKAYTVQKINKFVFKNPNKLMNNISKVTKHITNYYKNNSIEANGKVLNFKSKSNGKYCYFDGEDYWRIYDYIDGVHTVAQSDNLMVYFEAGKAFGEFQNILSDFPADTLYETIPEFHNTVSRLEQLKKSANENSKNRLKNCKKLYEEALLRKDKAEIVCTLLNTGEIPQRVTHNDTKLNNILFDNKNNSAVCIIDLDTVMPGSSLYDFGDSIRFGANTAAEDEKDLNKVHFNLKIFEKFLEGYLSTAGKALTKKELELLPFSCELMTYECAIRFLKDYLDGDIYFKINYPEHNLDRAKNQFALLFDMEKKESETKIVLDKLLSKLNT